MGHKTNNFLVILFAIAFFSTLHHISKQIADMPEVHKRWSTNECVRMIVQGDELSCPDDLPEKYITLWVK